MSDLYFNEKKKIMLRKTQFEPEQKNTCGNKSHKKGTKHIQASAADLLHIRIKKSRLVQPHRLLQQNERNRLSLL